MSVSQQSIMRSVFFLLLILSLGVRSIVPQGLMIAGSADGGLEIILCDGSNGLGSIPAFKKMPGLHDRPMSHEQMSHEQMSHEHMSHEQMQSGSNSGGSHHEEGGECEECDFLWASNGFDDAVSIDIDLVLSQFEQARFQSRRLAFLRFSSTRLYQARAPPSYFV